MERILSDGTRLVIRPIRPSDKAGLSAGLTSLSEVSRHRRFLSPKVKFTAAELRYLTELDGHDHAALVAHLMDGTGVGVARYVHLPGDPPTADVAIVVADAMQSRGLGSLMADELAVIAAQNGIHRFSADILSDNVPAQRLLARLSDRLRRSHDGAGQRPGLSRPSSLVRIRLAQAARS
ncbi:MAG TPA: GNAT family N-acetyltransferase, partial [Thermoleophilaceae bacterium]|nr:GNAT family N-acetyltransferase [Thermoleophilaceae bacterium]